MATVFNSMVCGMNEANSPIGYIFNIQRYAIHDGPGIRITIFFQGCPLRCWWCHTPEGMRIVSPPNEKGNPFKAHRTMTVTEAIREIEKEILFFDESGGGVTFSGGEPLLQHLFLKPVLQACRQREIHTALDTTGYAPPEILASIMEDVDLFLYDLKLMDDSAHEKYTGVSNEPILANLRILAECGKKIIIRFPLIPGITDAPENLVKITDLAASIPSIEAIHILPYHQTAGEKYRRLNMDNRLSDLRPPSPQQIETVRIQLEKSGLPVHIGGSS